MPNPPCILIVDDDPNLLELLQLALEHNGYATVLAHNGLEGETVFNLEGPDLVMLDVMMPHRDGFTLCQVIRQQSNVPIIMLTARQEVEDVVHGLELGADDYITKPFNLREVIARVGAVLGRIERQRSAPPRVITIGAVTADLERRNARVNDREVVLSPLELELLHYLMSHPGKVFDREMLLHEVWGYEYFGKTNLVDVAIRRLREKIERDPSVPDYILTVRGQGYRFVAENELSKPA
ncbi:MAG: response regulator transcription factor [Chloroflexi bacterium]|nr:response regulator transcription factor [Chloroflexota bacterium]